MNLSSAILGPLAASFLASCASAPKIDSKTDAVLSAMSAKLAAAKTLRAEVTRNSSPGFTVGTPVAQSATGTVIVERPARLAARLKTGEGSRAIGFDGGNLTVVDNGAGTHSVVKAPGDLDSTVFSIQKIYGITPPVGQLLVNHPRALLLEGVKTGKYTGSENINGEECDRLDFSQDGLTWQLWVATGDKLPRRISLAYYNGEGGAPLTMTATIRKWELDPVLSDADLTVKIPAGSRELEMIPLE
jgi:hypothetical protein